MKNYSIILFAFILLGCTEFVDDQINQPEGEELVLIYGFISPEEEQIKISVSETKSIFDEDVDFVFGTNEDLIIEDATVAMENEDGTSVSLLFDDTLKRYVIPASSFPIEPGNEYRLNVIAKGQSFTATCTIPEGKVEDVISSLGFRIDEFGQRVENLKVQFEDIRGTNNFYIVGAKYKPIGGTDIETSNAFFGQQRFVTDVTGDGFPVISDGLVSGISDGLEITAQVGHVDELIYRTLLANFINPRRSDDDPFFRPIIPPTNIEGEGSYGVFAGFRLTEKTENVTPD